MMRQITKIIKWDFKDIWKGLLIILAVIPVLAVIGVFMLKVADWKRGAHAVYLTFEIAVQLAIVSGIMLILMSVSMKYFSAKSMFDFTNISATKIIAIRVLEVFAVSVIFTLMGVITMTVIDSCYTVDYGTIRNTANPQFMALSAVGRGALYLLLPIGSGIFSLLVLSCVYMAGRVYCRFKSRELGAFVCVCALIVSSISVFLSIYYFDNFIGFDLNVFAYDFLFPKNLIYSLIEQRTNMRSMFWFTSFTNVLGLTVKLIMIFMNIMIGLALDTLKSKGGQRYGY